MSKFIVALFVLMFGTTLAASAQSLPGGQSVAGHYNTQGPTAAAQCDQTQAISFNGTGTATIAGVAGKRIWYCGQMTGVSGPTTLTFETGTGAGCSTNTVLLSGTIPLPDGTIFGGCPGGIAAVVAPVGSSVCFAFGGAPTNVQGIVFYVIA